MEDGKIFKIPCKDCQMYLFFKDCKPSKIFQEKTFWTFSIFITIKRHQRNTFNRHLMYDNFKYKEK